MISVVKSRKRCSIDETLACSNSECSTNESQSYIYISFYLNIILFKLCEIKLRILVWSLP